MGILERDIENEAYEKASLDLSDMIINGDDLVSAYCRAYNSCKYPTNITKDYCDELFKYYHSCFLVRTLQREFVGEYLFEKGYKLNDKRKYVPISQVKKSKA